MRQAKLLSILALLLMAVTQTAWAETPPTIGSITYDTDGGYYVIDEADDLRDLATYVNGTGYYRGGHETTESTAHDCAGLKFKMTGDIEFDYQKDTDNEAAWNDASNGFHNYEAIGSNYNDFKGDFDGDGHTLSGVRIYRGWVADDNWYKGIFGRIGTGANIHGLTLANARITGYEYTGGIVGYNYGGTISDCHVASNVCIHAVESVAYHGGIAGYNHSSSTIKNCTSAATLTIKSETTGCQYYGAIVGFNYGTLTDNFAFNATVPAAGDYYGAIAGYNSTSTVIGTLERNYYTACTVAGVEKATGVGCQKADVTDNDGAVSVHAVSLDEAVSITSPSQPTIIYNYTNYYRIGVELTLSNTAAPAGYQYGYKVNDTAISGNTYTINATDGDVTIRLGELTVIDWATVNAGTAADPYMIYNADQLSLLAYRVNRTDGETADADGFSGKYFRLGADIEFRYDDTTSDTNNFKAIGGYYGSNYYDFKGDFDGDGHTISGVRIYSGYATDADCYKGIFGRIGTGANIHGLTLANARITGYEYTGGIVGYNYGGTITNCHVANNVCIHAAQSSAHYHGGIAGYNHSSSTIKNCTSAATLTIADGATGCQYYGAIAGYNYGTLTGNLAIGATVPAAVDYGAIAGYNSTSTVIGTLERNYYTACTVAGVENATGKGCQNADVTDNDGAVPALSDQASNTQAIALLASTTVDLGWGSSQFPLQLAGRTLYKDGSWNTICLPFALSSLTDTPLEGATVKTLSSATFADGTLTLNFSTSSLTETEAGKPYIVKWGSGDDIVDPVFNNVTISSTEPTDVVGSAANFHGIFSPYATGGKNTSMLYLGADNTLYYPNADMTIGAFRAYFTLNGITAGDLPQQARRFVLNFGDEATGILTTDLMDYTDKAGAWYDIQGRRLTGKPTTSGIYINNGKKIIIK